VNRLLARLRRTTTEVGRVWRKIRGWRRIRFTSGGLVFTLGTVAVGFAAMNTGNNLLHLLVGSMLGFMTVSGWLSEQVIRSLAITRRAPRAVMVGQDMRIRYEVRNRKRYLPTLAVELIEEGLSEPAFLHHVPPGQEVRAQSVNGFVRRGIHPLGTLTLSTAFPFGLFRKERDIRLPGEIIVRPRTDRAIPVTAPAGGRTAVGGPSAGGGRGVRGEYRGLRSYRAGDDPKDIHWRSSARLREPVVREYQAEAAETCWICLDARGEPDDRAEIAVEIAAALAARAVVEQRPFGLIAPGVHIEPESGPAQLDRVLDALALVDFSPGAPPPAPAVDPGRCTLVTTTNGGAGFGATIPVPADAVWEGP